MAEMYIMEYNMYIMNERTFTVAEFRAKLKGALTLADEGTKVIIDRRGVRYILVSEEAVKEARKQAPPENKKNIPEPEIVEDADWGA